MSEQSEAMTQVSSETIVKCKTADGLELHVRCWPCEGAARALVVVAHGIIEHSGRYAELAAALNRAGMVVWAADNRGHGLSSGDRLWVDRFDRFAEDLSIVVGEARKACPGLPLFLLGHSMGGLIVLRTFPMLSEKPAGLILSAPAISVSAGLFPWLQKIAALGSRWFPRLRLVRMGSSRLSRDPEVVAQFLADPLVFHERITTRIGGEILRVSEEVRGKAADVTLPLLMLQGTADAVVSPRATEEFYRAARSDDKTLRLYPGLYHDLPREPEKEKIFAEVVEWVEQRYGRPFENGDRLE